AQPPPGVLVAAGSTGTAPATARLLGVIAGLPQGAVVLPGLDEGLAEDAWEQVGEQHPQGAMRRLLDGAGATRADVRPWVPVAARAAAPREPVRLLAVAKHPLLRAEPSAARDLELKGLRGPAPRDADQLRAKLEKHSDALTLAERVLAAAGRAAAPYLHDQA